MALFDEQIRKLKEAMDDLLPSLKEFAENYPQYEKGKQDEEYMLEVLGYIEEASDKIRDALDDIEEKADLGIKKGIFSI